MMKKSIISNWKSDLPASIVVFFVALPLCLGIALASGAPLISGLLSGIVGGLVVGILSGSKIGVSGPAAGLVAIVITAIGKLDGFENFLMAVVLGGVIQLVLGLLKAGVIGYYFPSSVIKGMLMGIGIIIILKQIPHFFGYDRDPEGDFAFFQIGGENTFSELLNTFNHIQLGSTIIGIIGLGILLLWDKILLKKGRIFHIIQAPLVAVTVSIIFYFFTESHPLLGISKSHVVSVPIPDNFSSFLSQLSFPNFSLIINREVWVVAITIAIVASLETLLCVEATDKLDPDKNVTPTSRELVAQGTGNIISGLIGGLPITQVIVRSSANIQSGGRSRLSTILHGIFLLLSFILIPHLLNSIPLSVLAAILLMVGYKLAKPSTIKKVYDLGWEQFIPFIVTVLGIVFTDLLIGIGLGLAVGIVTVLIKSYQNSHFLKIEDKSNEEKKVKMTLAEEVTFFNKATILNELNKIQENSFLEIDVRKTIYLDNDIIEILEDFTNKSKLRNISVKLLSERGSVDNPSSYIEFFKLRTKS